MDKLIEYMLVGGIIEAVAVSSLLAFFATRNKPANRMLGCFVLLWGIILLDHLFYRTEQYQQLTELSGVFWPLSVALAPTLYLYADRLLNENPRWLWVLHYMPLIFYYGSLFPFFSRSASTKIDYLYGDYDASDGLWQVALMGNVVILQFLIYTPLIMLKIRRYNKHLKQNYSNINERDVNWLTAFFFVSMLVFVISIVGALNEDWIDRSQLLMIVVIVLTLFFFSFKSLRLEQISNPIFEEISNKKSVTLLSDELGRNTVDKLINDLAFTMQSHKPYLNYDLCLEELSEMIDLDKRSFSQLLSQELNMKFYDFINHYRINEAKQRIKMHPALSFTQVASDVGFKSRTTFYQAFKKFTGITPKEFKSNINKVEGE